MNNNYTSSVTNSNSTNSSDRTNNDSASRRSADKPEPPKREAVDRFTQLIENKEKLEMKNLQPNQELGKEKKEHVPTATDQAITNKGALHGHSEEKQTSTKDMFATQSNDAAAMMFQAQLMASHPAPVTSGHVQVNPNAFADMIEKHVKQLAVTEGVNEKDEKVLLKMSDMTLPGTDFLLSRNEGGGWVLRADVHSRSSFDAITRAAPQLAKRFAEKNLGELEINPHFLG